MWKSIIAIGLITGLALPAAAGPYRDAVEMAEKAYHDCIVKKHQNRSTANCKKLHDEYLKAVDAYRNSEEYTGDDLEPTTGGQQTLEALQYRVERLERRMGDLERELDELRGGNK